VPSAGAGEEAGGTVPGCCTLPGVAVAGASPGNGNLSAAAGGPGGAVGSGVVHGSFLVGTQGAVVNGGGGGV
jgi:hypothetical protein